MKFFVCSPILLSLVCTVFPPSLLAQRITYDAARDKTAQDAMADAKDAGGLSEFAEDSGQAFNTKVCTQIRTDQSSSDPKIEAAANAAFAARNCAAVQNLGG